MPLVRRLKLTLAILVVAILFAGPVWSAEEPAPGGSESLPLEQQIQEIERIDQVLAGLTQEFKSTQSAPARQKIQEQIRQFQQKQEPLLLELEKTVGPLPPAVRPEKPIPLEQELKAQERRHETTLDSNVERRTSSR